MIVLGIETSCDECAAAVVQDGVILSNVVASQVSIHSPWQGVVPEIASRMHTEWIYRVAHKALADANLRPDDIQGVAATSHPGLLGSLLVGLHFAKAFAWAKDIPFIAVDHMLAHLYASRLRYKDPPSDQGNQFSITLPQSTRSCAEENIEYPFLGLLVSGGHSLICRADNFDDITVLGTTIDDAVGEAFDKVAKFYSLGYPGGVAIDRLAQNGNSNAFNFPLPNLYKLDKQGKDHRYDVSYSGLKTAVINQLEQFRNREKREERKKKKEERREKREERKEKKLRLVSFKSLSNNARPSCLSSFLPFHSSFPQSPVPSPQSPVHCDIAASFQKTAIEILLRALFRAIEDTGLRTVVAGGGVAANSYLRSRLAEYAANQNAAGKEPLKVLFPPLELCGDNAAMAAGLGEQYLLRGDRSPLDVTASARVDGFKKRYP